MRRTAYTSLLGDRERADLLLDAMKSGTSGNRRRGRHRSSRDFARFISSANDS